MIKILFYLVLTLITVSLSNLKAASGEPQFQEVYDILKNTLKDVSPDDLQKAALDGIFKRFSNRVQLIEIDKTNVLAQPQKPVEKVVIFENAYGYFKIGEIKSTIIDEFLSALTSIESTNKLKGIILDLRFARGSDYSALVNFAGVFCPNDNLFIEIDGKKYTIENRPKKVALPVVTIVNSETGGSAEVLAELLRESRLSIIIGTKTQGSAMAYVDHKLKTGQILRVASVPVKLSNGLVLSSEGIKPDISVDVDVNEERLFIEDPYRLPKRLSADGQGTTARISRPRLNEAELVRMKKENIDFSGDNLPEPDPGTKTTPSENLPKVIHDPSLARAIDVLKALSMLNITPVK